jgi:hypothetical protein
MGKLKQLHIDCTPGHCYARGYESTCYMQEQDTEPTEPPENTDSTDRDPNIDMDRD